MNPTRIMPVLLVLATATSNSSSAPIAVDPTYRNPIMAVAGRCVLLRPGDASRHNRLVESHCDTMREVIHGVADDEEGLHGAEPVAASVESGGAPPGRGRSCR